MSNQFPEPKKRRVYSPNKKNWVDIVEYGEIAMSAEKREYTTSFSIDGTIDFMLVNGGCCFLDDNRFIIYDSKLIVLNYLREGQTMFLNCENAGRDCFGLDVDVGDLTNPTIVIKKEPTTDVRLKLSEALQYFKPGRSPESQYLKR